MSQLRIFGALTMSDPRGAFNYVAGNEAATRDAKPG
jgi:hypothetical protein